MIRDETKSVNVAHFIIVIIIALAGIVSCTPRYVPNRLNVPLLKEQHEVRASLNIRNAQLAYSPVKNFGLMANGFFRERSYSRRYSEDDNIKDHLSLAEGGFGYYKPFARDSAFVFDVYGGYGVGRARVNIEEYKYDWNSPGNPTSTITYRNFKSNQNRFFVQPSLGYTNRFVDVVLSARFSALTFSNVELHNFTPSTESLYGFSEIANRRYYLVEPALTVRAGFKPVKFETQVGYTSMLNHKPSPLKGSFVSPRIFVNFSLHLNFAPSMFR